MGGSVVSRTYKDVFGEWSKNRSNSYKKSMIVRRVCGVYSVDYFGKMLIDKITSKDFHEYFDWRKQNYKKKVPSNET